MQDVAYLDYNATAPLRPYVEATIKAYVDNGQYNPSSINEFSSKLLEKIEICRDNVASALGVPNVIFTSGATESNNIMINDTRYQPFVLSGDHDSISANRNNVINVDASCDGGIALDSIINKLAAYDGSRKKLFSCSYVMGVTGIINPVEEIYRICKKYNTIFHCDLTQAFGRCSINPTFDTASISGHKIGSLQGIGCLCFFETETISPFIIGGAQQPFRAGTYNTLGIISLNAAISQLFKQDENNRIKSLRDELEAQLMLISKKVAIICHNKARIGNTSCIRFNGVLASIMKIHLEYDGVLVSYGSACKSGSEDPPEELLAMGIPYTEAEECIRFSLGWGTKREHINRTIASVMKILN